MGRRFRFSRLFTILVVGAAFSSNARAGNRPPPIPPVEGLAAVHPPRVYKVEPIPVRGRVKPRSEKQEQDLKAAAAVILAKKPIPADRVEFFARLFSQKQPVNFDGWNAFVEQSFAAPGGRLITLRVSAIASFQLGGSMVNNYIEEYFWADGQLRYVRGYCCPIIGPEPVISSL